MPSVLDRIPPTKMAQTTVKQVGALPLRSPFLGYVPDLAQFYQSEDGLISCRAVGVIGGRLVLVDGWRRLDATVTTLALGHDGDTSAFTDSGGAQFGAGGTSVTTAGNDKVQPVVHLASMQRFTAATGLGEVESLAITANTYAIGTGEPPYQESGHLYRKPTQSSGWGSVEFRSRRGVTPYAPTAGARPPLATAEEWVDSTVWSPGIPGMAEQLVNGVNHAVRITAESVFIWTNHADEVMYYPDETGSGNYTDFQSYVSQLTDLGTAVAAAGGFYQAPSFTTLKARSVAVFGGRVVYFNTVEGTTHYSTRLRFSAVGHPFLIWPEFEIDLASPTIHFDGVGSGWFDIDQFQTPGQTALPLGDVLACYSKDGVAFARRTGVVIDPLSIEYVTLDRGVLAPGCVTPIHAAQHFAIMTDGWYVVNANGILVEVGAAPESTSRLGAGTGRTYKWKEDFYRRLDFRAVEVGRLFCQYEPNTKYVRILAPMLGGDEIWNYDTQNDRVFLDNYTNINGLNQTPESWGLLPRGLEATTWTGAGPTTWSGYTGRTWSSFAATLFSDHELCHGDSNGLIYQHDRLLGTRDTEQATWNWRTAARSLSSNPDETVVVDGVAVTYDNQEATPATASTTATVEVVGYSERERSAGTSAQYTETGTIDMTRGDAGEMATDDVGFRVSGDAHQVAMNGTGNLSVHEVRLRVYREGTPHRRLEGT